MSKLDTFKDVLSDTSVSMSRHFIIEKDWFISLKQQGQTTQNWECFEWHKRLRVFILSLQKQEMFHFLQVVMIVSRSVILKGIIQVNFVLIAANWNADKNVLIGRVVKTNTSGDIWGSNSSVSFRKYLEFQSKLKAIDYNTCIVL